MQKIINSDNHHIAYQSYGNENEKHTIIMAHGNGNSAADYVSLGYVDKLVAQNFKVIIMDAIGYGQSDKPHGSQYYTPEKRAADVITVMDALNINTCQFFGNSIGGSLGFVLAARYPQRFKSFIIGSAHPYGSSQPIGANLYPEEFKLKLKKEGIENFVKYVETDLLHKKFPEAVRQTFLQNNIDALIAANSITWPDYSESLSKISVPVLLFAGELDPVAKFQQKIAKHIKDCRVEILKDHDHPDAYWKSDSVVPIILSFIHETFGE